MRFLRRLRADNPSWVIGSLAALFIVGSVAFFARTDDEGKPAVHIGSDGRYYWAFLTTLVLDRDLDFSNQYDNPRSGNYLKYAGAKNVYTVGPALAWMPAFLIAHAVSLAVEPPAESADGNSFLTQKITLYSSFLYAFAGMLLAYGAARRRYRPGPALAGAVAAGACGPLLWYSLQQPSYSHAVSAAAVTALLVVWERGRGRRGAGGWILLGALTGVAMLMREQNLVYGLPAAVEAVWTMVKRRDPRPLFGALAALLAFLPQLIVWKLQFDSWLGVPQGGEYMRWGASMWPETLWSSRSGLFPFAPAWLFGMVGVAAMVARQDRVLGAALLGTFAVTAYVNGAVGDWWGIGMLANRRYDGLLLHVTLGTAALVRAFVAWVERRPRLAAGLAVAAAAGMAVTCQSGMLAEFATYAGKGPPLGNDMLEVYGRALGRAGRLAFRLGNPLSWPAPWVFAARTGMPPSRYDEVIGPTVMNGAFNVHQPLRGDQHVVLSYADPTMGRYVGDGLGEPVAAGRPMTARRARLLVPVNVFTGLNVTLRVLPAAATTVRVSWNGDPVAEARVTGRQDLVFWLTAGQVRRGLNVVDIEAEPGLVVSQLTLDVR